MHDEEEEEEEDDDDDDDEDDGVLTVTASHRIVTSVTILAYGYDTLIARSARQGHWVLISTC